MKIKRSTCFQDKEYLRRHPQLWKCFGRLYFIVIVLDRNIVSLLTLDAAFIPVEDKSCLASFVYDSRVVTTLYILGAMTFLFEFSPLCLAGEVCKVTDFDTTWFSSEFELFV
ncbi:hypothetical protein Tco_1178281 [Tanacetum coccineum]